VSFAQVVQCVIEAVG